VLVVGVGLGWVFKELHWRHVMKHNVAFHNHKFDPGVLKRELWVDPEIKKEVDELLEGLTKEPEHPSKCPIPECPIRVSHSHTEGYLRFIRGMKGN